MNAENHLCILESRQKLNRACSKHARLGEQIIFAPLVLNAIAENQYDSIHYDLLVLCAAIEYADRCWKRNHEWTRSLRVTVPVVNLSVWQDPAVSNALVQALRHLTCDNWSFEFVQAREQQSGEGQRKIIFPEKKTFAIAYSEGLDSRAAKALSGSFNEAISIRVAKTYHRAKEGDGLFTQLPFSVVLEKGRESSFRSRSFQFASFTAIAAHLADITRIIVPESGQGALSPAILPLHRTYADYRNHPTFFRKMEHFILLVLKHRVHYEQPRLWFTKGQTLCEFLKLPEQKPDHLIHTRSCWQVRGPVNQGGKRRQCGVCAACLLRRFSLKQARVDEPAGTYVVQDLRAQSAKEAMAAVPPKYVDNWIDYAIAGVRHFQQFADLSKATDGELMVHSFELADSMNASEIETMHSLSQLLLNHAEEWNSFLADQGSRSFLLKWLQGGS